MAKEFLLQFAGLPLTVGQPLVFSFMDKKLLGLSVKNMEAVDTKQLAAGTKMEPKPTNFGLFGGNTMVQFEKSENSALNLTGKAKG
jgi:vesicle-fusing ATPase